jgi:nicotinamide riboside kinase
MNTGPAGPLVRDPAEAGGSSMPAAFVIAILGAESTAATSLADRLGQSLMAKGRRVVVVPDALHEFRERHQRAPAHDELPQVAREQTHRIEAAAATHGVVVSAATALTIAVHNERVFGDVSLYPEALAAHRGIQLTLLHALDVPPPSVDSERTDALSRSALLRAGCGYSVIAGRAQDRLAAAVKAVRHALQEPHEEALPTRARWKWVCERCSDADCERHLLARG